MFTYLDIKEVLGEKAVEDSNNVVVLTEDLSVTIGIRETKEDFQIKNDEEKEVEDLNWIPIVDSININI